MGLSSSKSKSTSTQSSTSTPTAPGWLQQPFQDYYKQAGGLLNQGFTGGGASGASDIQNQVYGAAGGLLSERGPSGYNASGYNPSGVDVGQLSHTDLSPYMNPFTNEVIDRSLGDLNRGREMAISSGEGAATMAGAYGGSRHGVADSLTNREFADSAGNLSANLRSQGFLNAQQGALTDIGNRFAADQFNSSAMNTAGQFNAGAMNDAGRFNATAMNNADANTRANLGLLAGLGESQRETNMAGDPQTQQAEWLARMQSLLGLNPNAFIGNNSTGTATGTQSSNPGLLGGLGSLAMGLGGLGWSPFGGK